MSSYEIGSGMRYLSVCDGIGAVHLAWQRLGWRCVGVSEIAPFPAAVVEHHFGFRNLGDMTRFREWPERLLADVDLLVGGTPCQSFSVAGKRRSLDDERGNLTRVYVDLFHHINRIRRSYGRLPAIAVWENVKGALKTKDNAFGCLLGGLLGCDEAPQPEEGNGKWDKAGFLGSESIRVGWRTLNSEFFAVAQRRRRVFLVAVPCELVERFGDRACPSEILSLPGSVLGDPPTRGGKRQGAAARPQDSTAEGGGQPFFLDRDSFNQGRNARYEPRISIDGVSSSLVACGTHAVALMEDPRDGAGGVAGPLAADGCMLNSDRVAWAIDGRNQSLSEDVHHTLRVGRDSGDAVVVGSSEVAGTLTASRGTGFRSNGTPIEGVAIADNRARRLTPRECERLMGFPDDFTAITYLGKPAADAPRYKALGNSIVVPIPSWIGQRISKVFPVDGADTEGPSSAL